MEKESIRVRLLKRWGKWSVRHWKKTFILAGLITLVMLYGISLAEPQMTYYSILPEKEKNVQELKEIIRTFPLASGIIAVIDGRDISDPQEAKRKVEAVIDDLSREFGRDKYSPYIKNTIGEIDMSLFKQHGLMLMKKDDIRRLSLMSGDFDQVLDKYLSGESYMLSNDGRMGLFVIEPAFTMEDIGIMVEGVNLIEGAVKRIAFENGVNGGLTGLTVVGRDEMATSEKGLAGSSLAALILILALMIFTFRMFSAPLVSGIPLVIGILWTIGLAGFIIHRLNIITAMYMVVLLGLGIDYAIHLLTAFVQERDEGAHFEDAVVGALGKSGSGIIIGALTSAAAFFMLMTAKTEMVSELGIVAGLGILSELSAMLMLIPPILSFRNYRKEKKGKQERAIFKKVSFSAHAASGLGRILVKSPLLIAVVMVCVVTGFAFYSGKVSIETNIMNMEAKGLESIRLQNEMTKEFGMAPDGLSVIEDNLSDVKVLSRKLEKLSSVKRVESIAPYVVTDEEWKERLPEIKKLKALLKDEGKTDNVINKELREQLLKMASEEKVDINMVPASIRDSYVSADGDRFLLSIIPTKNPWDGEFRKIFTSQIETVTPKATGMILAGDQLSNMAKADGLHSSIAAVIAIFIILLMDFKNLKLASVTLIPLAASFLVLFGIMGIFNIKFDFINIIAVPLLIGIGIDDAVHINHRYLLEGNGSMARVIGKTGTALLLTSLTTIIGFASFIPSPMRAMKSTGIVLSLAMAIAFINSVLLHPAVLVIMAEKLKFNIYPWGKRGNKDV